MSYDFEDFDELQRLGSQLSLKTLDDSIAATCCTQYRLVADGFGRRGVRKLSLRLLAHLHGDCPIRQEIRDLAKKYL